MRLDRRINSLVAIGRSTDFLQKNKRSAVRHIPSSGKLNEDKTFIFEMDNLAFLDQFLLNLVYEYLSS